MSGLSALVKSGTTLIILLLAFEGPTNGVSLTGPQENLISVRTKRNIRVKWTEKDIQGARDFAELTVQKLKRHEENLNSRKIKPHKGTSAYAANLASSSFEDKALKTGREGFIGVRASVYLASRNCLRYGLSSSYCADQLMKISKTCEHQLKCQFNPYRSIDGTCNNQFQTKAGSVFTPYARLLPAAYDDGFWEPRGSIKRLPNPLIISEKIRSNEFEDIEKTMAVTAWSTLVEYDLSQTVSNRMMYSGENIMCCTQTGFNLAPRYRHTLCFPVNNGHNKCFNYVRSMVSLENKCQLGSGEQMNGVTHYLDGSGIYGSTKEASSKLRSFKHGKLIVDVKEGKAVLPRTEVENCHHHNYCYLTGEVRINMNIISAGLHIIMVREHNRIASFLSQLNPHWSDERLFQEARKIVIAEIQHITYNEWLPVILGKNEFSKHKFLQVSSIGYSSVYNKNIKPSVLNSFANAAIKFTSSMLDEDVMLFDEKRNSKGSILVREASVKPEILEKEIVFDSLIRGLSTQNALPVDLKYSSAVSKFYFSVGNSSGIDALSYDIQRGRDHGLPSYSQYRKLFGLSYESFVELSEAIPQEIINKMKSVYTRVSDVDLLVGGMAENPIEGGLLGPVFASIVADQFVLTRVGDKYFYDNKLQPQPFTQDQLKQIKKITLARLFCDNSNKVELMQREVFLEPDEERNVLSKCSDSISIPEINLSYWQEKV